MQVLSEVQDDLEADAEMAAKRVVLALGRIVRFGQDDGSHHKAWVIDQVTRLLAGPLYDRLVAEAKAGDDGPNTYGWDEGIPP